MQNLKRMISRYMNIITAIIVVLVITMVFVFQMLSEQRRTRENAISMLGQMEQILAENQRDLETHQSEYKNTCLKNAESSAYIIEENPLVLESLEELQKIASFIEVDEIHIFDKTGRIFTGTHPEYYNMTVDSGEQIGFFKPMLKDKSLKLCQDITPNTAEGKMMQYSAVWSKNGDFIVQVGMEPVHVMNITKKNELSYIFSLLSVNVGVDYYAIDAENGEIVGATVPKYVGKNYASIGFDWYDLTERGNGFHASIDGVRSYCIFTEVEGNLIGQVISNDVLYQRVPVSIAILGVTVILVGIIQVYAVTRYMNRQVVGGINHVNEKLREITAGNLNESVEVQNSTEFSELSTHINEMLKSILDNSRKMSYVLSKTDMYIGVYEYNENMKNVRITEYVSKILGLDDSTAGQLASDINLFKEYIAMVRANPVSGADGVFCLKGDSERYIRIEEVVEKGETFGVVIDVTAEMSKRRQLEAERDIDALTGLYNRRGLENKLSGLFMEPEKLGYGAFIMLDADGLKGINDKYGHEKGDVYLKKISEVMKNFGLKECVESRLGGDEFVLFLYGYDSEEELLNTIKTLEYVQNYGTAFLGDQISVPLRFSFGVCLTKGRTDYENMLKQADEKMYANKRGRKESADKV